MIFFNSDKIKYKFLSFFLNDINALKIVYKVLIGKGCRLRNNNYGSEPFLISFGDYVSAINVDFITHDGAVWVLRRKNSDIDLFRSIQINSNVYIGNKTTILPGTHIESNVIIGACSLVKGNLKSGYVYAGVPAKKICSIEEYYKKNKKFLYKTKNLSYKNKKNFLMHLMKNNTI